MFSRIKKLYKEYKDLKYLAYHDSLTGLLNRNWFYKNVNNINVKYIYFIDINNLHEINKKGHSYGDEYIKKAVSTIKHNGTLIRYAGDEFILFSDYENEVTNNEYYCVGVAEVNDNISDSINEADTNMLKSKLLKFLWFLFFLKII